MGTLLNFKAYTILHLIDFPTNYIASNIVLS